MPSNFSFLISCEDEIYSHFNISQSNWDVLRNFPTDSIIFSFKTDECCQVWLKNAEVLPKAHAFRGYPNKHHVQVILEVKEDKVDKFLELIPGLFFGSQVL